jgi:hypothetical protein
MRSSAGSAQRTTSSGSRRTSSAIFLERPSTRHTPWSRFREFGDESGALTCVRGHRARLAIIRNMPLWDVQAERTVTVADRFDV